MLADGDLVTNVSQGISAVCEAGLRKNVGAAEGIGDTQASEASRLNALVIGLHLNVLVAVI